MKAETLLLKGLFLAATLACVLTFGDMLVSRAGVASPVVVAATR